MTTIGTAALAIIPSFEGFSQAVDKQLGGKMKVTGKQAGQQLSKGIGDGLKEAGDAYSKFRDKAEDALGKVRKEEAALQDLRDKGINSGARFVAAEERLATARRNSNRAVREAEDSHKSLLSAQNSLGSGTDELGGKFGKLSGLASTLGPALASAGALAGGAALAGIALLGAGAVKATSELYDLGSQFDDLNDSLRLTGATGGALDALEASVDRIGAKVPLALGDIGSLVSETSRAFKGLAPDDFDNLVSHVANLGRLTGEQVNVRNLGKAFRIMGVDVKDQVPTLDAFFRANEASGIGINELIGTVNRGGAQLKQFGLDMGSAAALVSSFESAGVDSTKVIPSLTAALKTFAKAGTDPRKGLEDTITQIKALADAGDQAGSLNLANKIFGAKGGVAFAEVIASGNLDIQTLTDSISTTGDTIDQAAADTDDWAEKWQTLKNQISTALKPLASATFDGINNGLAQFADWVTTHQPQIIDGVVQIGTAFIDMAHVVLQMTGLVIEGFGQMVGGIGNIYGAILKADSGLQRLFGNEDYANQLLADAEAAYGWGEGLEHLGQNLQSAATQTDGWKAALRGAGDTAIAALGQTNQLGDSIRGLLNTPVVPIDIKVNAIPGAGVATTAAGSLTIPIATAVAGGPPPPGSGAPGQNPLLAPFGSPKAGGGMLPGYSTVDNMLVPMAGGEGVIKSSVMRKLGAGWLNAINNGYANGGIVGLAPDVAAAEKLAGTPYSQGSRFDCSGTVARVINDALGLPGGGLMTTKNAQAWLSARGFVQGTGGRGAITVGWYDRGPNPNDGHMAMTLSDGTNAESGGRNSVFTLGAGAKGGADTGFDHHMYLPIASGQGPATGDAADALKKGAAAVTNPDGGIGGQGASTPSSGGSGLSLESSFSGLAGMGLSGLGAGVGATKSGSDLSVFGDAAASAVSGQVSSALGVFGVNDSPGWLKGISTLVGGISVGGQGSAGSSAAPVSGLVAGRAAIPPDITGNAHGTRAGQAPGPVYNIRTATVEDAYVQAQRQERERAAAKLSRF